MKWTATLCWREITYCGTQHYSAWLSCRGMTVMTVTWVVGTEVDHQHWVLYVAFGNTFHSDTCDTVYTYTPKWHMPYCLHIHFTVVILCVRTLHSGTCHTIYTYTAVTHAILSTHTFYSDICHTVYTYIPQLWYCLHIHSTVTHAILFTHALHTDICCPITYVYYIMCCVLQAVMCCSMSQVYL
jgi:hypothetical protein